MTLKQILDGIYFLEPEGSSWMAVEYRGGEIIDRTEASQAASELAGHGRWAGIAPSDSEDCEDHVEFDLGVAIIRDAMGDDHDPYMVIVTRYSDPR